MSLLAHMQIVKPQMYHPMCGAFLFAKKNFVENENKITADAPEIVNELTQMIIVGKSISQNIGEYS